MSEDNKDPEDESLNIVEPEEVEDDLDEDEPADVLEVDEMDEVDEVEEEEAIPEKAACMVIGQGDSTMVQSNRGADDPGDNTLAEPQFICKYGDILIVSDRANHRVLLWEQPPEEDGEPSSLVLGQEDFADCLENRGMTTTLDEMTSGLGDENLEGFTISQCEEDTLSQPAGIDVIDGKLYVVDSGNHRAVRWNGIPTEDGEPPFLVLGQDNLEGNEANRRGLVGSGSLFFPMGIHSGDGQHVFIADKDNHRVLIWNKSPFSDGWNADVTLGQPGMDDREPNRGEFDNVTPDTLSFPTGVFYHEETEKLLVVDQGNNRILIWNGLPRESGRAADVVIGQKDLVSREPNSGKGYQRPSEDGLYFPTDVVVGRLGMFVSDSGNHRILYWREVPTENGQPADLVIGQANLLDGQVNRGGEASGSTLNDPYGLFLEEDPDDPYYDEPEEEDEPVQTEAAEEGEAGEDGETSQQEEEKPGPIFKLYIADRGNSRVLVWDELPDPPKSMQDEEDKMEEIESEDPSLLIGDEDDDEDVDDFFVEEEEEEEEDGPPKEIPSV